MNTVSTAVIFEQCFEAVIYPGVLPKIVRHVKIRVVGPLASVFAEWDPTILRIQAFATSETEGATALREAALEVLGEPLASCEEWLLEVLARLRDSF